MSFTAALKHLGIDTMVFVDPRANAWLYRRDPRPLAPFDLVLARSRHVLASLRAAGIDRVHPQPFIPAMTKRLARLRRAVVNFLCCLARPRRFSG